MVAILVLPQPKAAARLACSPLARGIQGWGGVRSFQTAVAVSIPALALELWCSTTRILIQRVGTAALLLNTTGTENTAIGTAALVFNDTAEQNTVAGAFALHNHVSGNGNTAYGAHALVSDTTGQLNTAVRVVALANDDNGFNGSFNTGIGVLALFANNGGDNTAVGAMAASGQRNGQ